MAQELTGIILAAGRGSRLGDLTQRMPKPLVQVNGMPLIAYSLRFLRMLGATRIVVVGGYLYPELEAAVRQLDPSVYMVQNKGYERGSATSLESALNHVEGSFVSMVSDHVFRRDIPVSARRKFGPALTIFTDHDRMLTDDDMKVELDAQGVSIVRLAKTLRVYQCGYIGFSYCPADMVTLVRDTIARSLETSDAIVNVEHVWQRLADQGTNIAIGDVSGSKWVEIDTLEDLNRAQEEINANHEEYEAHI